MQIEIPDNIDPDDAYVGSKSQYARAFKQTQDRIAELEARKHDLRAMLDEMILSVQGENVYLCDEVWATADRLLAQLKDQDPLSCPSCGGPTEFDRCVPPNPYYCEDCEAKGMDCEQ